MLIYCRLGVGWPCNEIDFHSRQLISLYSLGPESQMNHGGLWKPEVWPHGPHDPRSGVTRSGSPLSWRPEAVTLGVLCVSLWHLGLPRPCYETQPSGGQGPSIVRGQLSQAGFARPVTDGHADSPASTSIQSLAVPVVNDLEGQVTAVRETCVSELPGLLGSGCQHVLEPPHSDGQTGTP